MSLLYDTYVRFMVWLGAEPPPAYKYLLAPKPASPVKKVPVKPKPAPPLKPPSRPASRPKPLTPQQKAEVDLLYRQLKARVLGDETTVKRLVDFERERKPNANPLVWLQDANQRWEHDNRW